MLKKLAVGNENFPDMFRKALNAGTIESHDYLN